MAKLLPEFPTEWHQQAYLEGCEREAAGYKRRIFELEELGLQDGDPAYDDAKRGLENAVRELDRVGGRKAAAKRPVRAAETR